MKVTVDTDRCVGNGVCEALSPDLFQVGDNGQAEVLVEQIPAEQEASVRQTVDSCPALALRLSG
ncbi:ferredoxin [Mycolicibacterium insubricum]|jgi:ferredoxin|uniref:Ferredoxin n=1 Tax=Mycolicibacterium insubricum TaxID=444597 RepID=A0A1X0D104_9MYCO|nr:ferredoxin [Mycolicibacterium insubricum]MCB9440229.1 ferredoxin [Mycolicibacterium sp.]MCV7080288.1 ferredoxin [Mycolicibacterium insubricum]ORA65899.1 ferredoxin [Mycolicibacterium insubricum]BBZ66340.1 ferredoxin [Mycolicibacterium insubricum]